MEYLFFNWVLLCYSFLGMTQKSKTIPLQSTDNESVSGHLSTLSSGSELSKLEQRFTTDNMEHTLQVSVVFHSVLLRIWRCWLSDARFSKTGRQIKQVQCRASTRSRTEYFTRTGISVQNQWPVVSATASDIDWQDIAKVTWQNTMIFGEEMQRWVTQVPH